MKHTPERRPNPDHTAAIRSLANRCPYFNLQSMRIVELDIGRSLLEIALQEKHMQPYGVVHGGVFASLIDAAAFWAVYYSVSDETAGMTTVDLKLNYLAPADSGRLVAEGRCIKAGRTLGYADVAVTDGQGSLLAHGASTLMVLPGKGLGGDSGGLPPKFVEG